MATEGPFERVFLLEASGPTLAFLMERSDRLPHVGRAFREGAYGRLRGPEPPVAPLSYATLLTGKNPGKTGIFDFFHFPAGGYERIPYELGQLRADPVYRTLSEHGLPVGLLNAMLTHPLPDLNGFVVSGDEGVGAEWARPADVRELLSSRGYRVPFGASYATSREQDFRRHLLAELAMRRDAFHALYGSREWSFGMTTLHGVGEVLHSFWRFYDPHHPQHRPFLEVFDGGDPILEVMQGVDAMLGEALELVGPNGLVLLVGAWGHRRESSRLKVNALLERAGLLRFRRSPKTIAKRLAARSGLSKAAVERLAHRLNLWKLFHYALPRGKRARVTGAAFLSFTDIDWPRTVAVATGLLGQVFLNVRGRRPLGTVDSASYDRERARVAALLEGVRDPRTGAPVVKRVFGKEEIYSGPELAHAPDLVLEMEEGWMADGGFGGSGAVVEDAPLDHSSDHAAESAYLALGAGVRQGAADGKLEDVAPTILAALGAPIPPDCDGAPLPIFHRCA